MTSHVEICHSIENLTTRFSTKSMVAQHLERFACEKSPTKSNQISSFRFQPIKSNSNDYSSSTKRTRRPGKRNWSVKETLYAIRVNAIEKIQTQDIIERSERARKIPPLQQNETTWKSKIKAHRIIWDKEVIKNIYHHYLETLDENMEFVLEPTDSFALYEEEDCF